VTEKLNALMNLMNQWKNAASENIHSTTIRSVAATLILSRLVLTVLVLDNLICVTVKPNAEMALMKVTTIAASRNSHSTATKDVDVKMTNGNVAMETASLSKICAMEKLNAKMDPMKVTNTVASRNSKLTAPKSVAAIQKMSGHVLMANALEIT
jgi:hypothetical protein